MPELDIVCVSFNFLPMNDAEALCTARTLSALAQSGAKIQLITSDSYPTLSQDLVDELLDRQISITRVPLNITWPRIRSLLTYGIADPKCSWIKAATQITAHLLQQYRNPPVLISRSMPIVSNIVGYYCRRHASMWIPHFSDPFPPDEWQNHWYSRFAKPFNRWWARKILSKADLVSVTCPNAIRYIEEKSGLDFRKKSWVLTHLAIPKLRSGNYELEKTDRDEFILAYIGNLMTRRRPELLLKGFQLANEKYPEIKLLVYGNVDDEILDNCRRDGLLDKLYLRSKDNLNPREAADLQEQVDVNIIVDTDLNLPYSPFILSKYPHCVCAGKPLLMISSPDSAMKYYTDKYGGGIFVSFSSAEDVSTAIIKLYEGRRKNDFPSSQYMAQFSPESIIKPFVEKIHESLSEKRRER